MSTRSITTFLDRDGDVVARMYRHCDGYPTGHGAELAAFLTGRRVVNGIESGDRDGKASNGVGCLAATVIAHFKEGIGDIYLVPIGRSWCEEYTYTVTATAAGSLHLTVVGRDTLYAGPPEGFDGAKAEALENIDFDTEAR